MPSFMCKRSKVSESENEVEEDRISSLPDNFLVSILSLLPIDSAAATSVLSSRWRLLWTHITLPPRLRTGKMNDDYLIANIDRILSQLNSPKLHFCRLCLSVFFKQVGSSVLLPWIHRICARNPEVLHLFFWCRYSDLDGFNVIPSIIFDRQSLVQLKLFGLYNIPDDDNGMLFINLPNLKILHLTLTDMSSNVMGTLFKSCPLLEDLRIFTHSLSDEESFIVNIFAPNLTRLYIEIRNEYRKSLNNHKFVIDAPLLEYCDIRGYFVFYHFVTCPINLMQVTISVEDLSYDRDDNDDYRSKILQLFPGICWVKRLILIHLDGPLMCFLGELDSVATPIFHNLINC